MESELKRSFQYHGEHYQHERDNQVHFQNTDIHWTSRERNDLNRRLDKQDEKADEILREIIQLGRRMDDDK